MDKKILIYTENYLPSIGGLENNTELLCESLVLLGFATTLITPQKDALKHKKFRVIESSSLTEFLSEIKKHDLLIVNGGVSFKIIIPALIAQKPYIIIYQMATLFRDIRSKGLRTSLLNNARKVLASFAKKNIGVSEYSFLELQQIFGKDKSDILINPADPKFLKGATNQNTANLPFQCLFAGRLIEGKGIKLLITAIRKMNKNKKSIHLHVIGDGPEKQYVTDHSNAGYIFYHPPVSKEELKHWLNSVHLTVIPSTHHIEGSPLIMAESLVMGVPVLVSSQPALVESIKHKALIFESGNLDDLVAKLNTLTSPDIYQIVQKHIEAEVYKYNYSNYFKQLKYLIDV
ncbi:MAG TPA: glycosyltransferase family 4 protein [Pelobium sp.]|nr:glycosyltransferase family 4 protein [Pelobium sp.]